MAVGRYTVEQEFGMSTTPDSRLGERKPLAVQRFHVAGHEIAFSDTKEVSMPPLTSSTRKSIKPPISMAPHEAD